MCYHCPLRRTCLQICEHVEKILPSMEQGRIDFEDLERLYQGRIMTHALLDNIELLTERQQQVVQLYYRENRQQEEIAVALAISQQAVHDALLRAKRTIGNKLKRYYSFF
jgi:RNA polymerase sigma factor (sigma-70 family)